ncbi:sensor histidine kinase [Paenibacillus sp. GCM10023248]|uniref:cache domain-containing sensor histidine kinase n=1 Tax=Bacillales TaxID=1385 RepID=UPI002378306D|nr:MULTISPECIES: sensor histidine kinase [Bacillales]MDD9268772.1 sensor histidine kinase [Paenibacillus sp. MAHUQ-63]MDR6882149.1 two-component system sensor histidine kinase YesM [Bacillus sp. 3255]
MGKRSRRAWVWFYRSLFLRDRPLTVKLLVYSAMLVVIPLLAVGLISYQKSSQVLREEANLSNEQIIEQVKLHIEYYIRDFEIDSIRMQNHPAMQQFLRMTSEQEVQSSGIREPMMQLLKDTAYSRADISRIMLVTENQAVLDTSMNKNVTPALELIKEPWFANVPANSDIMLIIRPPSERYELEGVPVLSIVKRLVSPNTLEPVATLIMEVNFKRIQEIAERVTIGRTGYLSILDSYGRYIYSPEYAKIGHLALWETLNDMLQQESGSYQAQTGDKPFYTFSRSAYLNWRLVTVIPEEELTRGTHYIRQTIWWTVAVTLVLAYLIGIGFASSIVRPVRALQYFMKRVKAGDFRARADIESKDEIGQLTNDFNKMVEKLQNLLDEITYSQLREKDLQLRQKETELKVLQSQVNPHFLMNALETVRGMALEHDMTDISVLVASLARLLRYNLNHAGATISVQQEVHICEMYLRIQQYRFEEKLSYEFRIPQWAEQQQIAKFALQPLVENCVIHGIETGDRPVHVVISAERAGEQQFRICIQDTGAGIPADKLRALQLDLLQKDMVTAVSQIGIVNVHRRIAYLFGDAYGLELESSAGAGTRVSIKLPLGVGMKEGA